MNLAFEKGSRNDTTAKIRKRPLISPLSLTRNFKISIKTRSSLQPSRVNAIKYSNYRSLEKIKIYNHFPLRSTPRN